MLYSVQSHPPLSRTTMNFDGLVRIPASELSHLRLSHLQSEVDVPEDEFATADSLLGAVPAQATGYTEWVGADDPGISLGWDWIVGGALGVLALRPLSIRTNVMLVDPQGEDLGEPATVQLLAGYLAGWDWQSAVLEQLRTAPGAG